MSNKKEREILKDLKSDIEMLEMFNRFTDWMVSGNYDADHYQDLICNEDGCTKVSPYSFLFIGFVGCYLWIQQKKQWGC